MVCLQRNQAAWGALTGGEIWEIVQSAALRCYGVVFTLMVTVAELSELETCKTAACVQGLCAPVHDSFAVKHWFLRGTIYVFVGLFTLEMLMCRTAMNLDSLLQLNLPIRIISLKCASKSL